jgi:hypothetical protein
MSLRATAFTFDRISTEGDTWIGSDAGIEISLQRRK